MQDLFLEIGFISSGNVEIQDNMGGWRVESTYPPADIEWNMIGMDECEVLSGGATITSSSQTTIECPMFENETRIVGTPTFHVSAQISLLATSGHLFVEMVRASDGIHLGHAVMDLRFHAGGKDGETLSPGSTVLAKMEFFGMDVVIPAGDGIQLLVSQTGEDYIPSPVSMQSVTVGVGATSILSLSTVNRGCDDLFMPPMMTDPYPQCVVED